MPKINRSFLFLNMIFFFASMQPSNTILYSAEFNGENLDGKLYDATAFSYSTAKYYDVQVEFDGDEATIYFSNGGHITVTLDDEVIEDPHNISTFDYKKAVFWDLDIDDID